jgi:hypothetical protein
MAAFVALVSPSQSSSGALVDRSASGLNTLRPYSSAMAGSVGSVQSWMPRSATRSGGGRSRQCLQELLVAVTGERGDDHGVEAGKAVTPVAMSEWESIQRIAMSLPCLLTQVSGGGHRIYLVQASLLSR